jgi:hypothetical protein
MLFKAAPIEWLSPVQQRLKWPRVEAKAFGGWHIRAWRRGPVENFVRVASRQAWWSYDTIMLNRVSRLLDISKTDAPAGGDSKDSTLFHCLCHLIKHTLACSDDEALEICKTRFSRHLLVD